MATELLGLEVDRVDFVDKGANPGALITLAKRATAPKEPKMAELPEEVAKRIADAEEAVAALTKRAEDAEKRADTNEAVAKKVADDLAAEVAKREASEAEAVAKALVLPGIEADQKVGFIQKVKRALGADWPTLEGVLKALAVADRTSTVFKELGSDAEAGVAKDGYDRLNEMAQSLMKADTKYTTRASALDAVLKTPEGKAEYEKYVATKTQRGA